MTTALPGLPNEIVLEIWSHVLEPKDVESFALASKGIYALAHRFIEEHQLLKKRFSKFSHQNKDFCGSSGADLLANILLNPRTAMYVDEIRIDGWKFEWDNPAIQISKDPSECHLPYPEDTMQLFEAAVKTSDFIPESDVAQWMSEIGRGDEENILALIMSLLPNVKRLALESGTYQEVRLLQMIRQIGRSPAATALSHLRDVELGWDYINSVTNDFDYVTNFSSLKSVKYIKGWGFGKLDLESDYWLSIPPKWSNVTSLHLYHCNIDHKRLSIYIQCVGALQEFSYVAAREGGHFDPFWLFTALAHAAHSLKSPCIMSADGMGGHMGSLASFNVLTELSTDYRMLLDYVAEFDSDKLIQMLPPSIEEVFLEHNEHYDVQSLQAPILGCASLRQTAFQSSGFLITG